MAKAKRIVLFLSANETSRTCVGVGVQRRGDAVGPAVVGSPAGEPAGAEVVVPLDGTPPEGFSERVEKWPGGDPNDAGNGLTARLLGGSDATSAETGRDCSASSRRRRCTR